MKRNDLQPGPGCEVRLPGRACSTSEPAAQMDLRVNDRDQLSSFDIAGSSHRTEPISRTNDLDPAIEPRHGASIQVNADTQESYKEHLNQHHEAGVKSLEVAPRANDNFAQALPQRCSKRSGVCIDVTEFSIRKDDYAQLIERHFQKLTTKPPARLQQRCKVWNLLLPVFAVISDHGY